MAAKPSMDKSGGNALVETKLNAPIAISETYQPPTYSLDDGKRKKVAARWKITPFIRRGWYRPWPCRTY